MRLEFTKGIFQEMGFKDDDAEMRPRLFICYHTWERSMFDRDSKKSLREMVERRLE